MQVIMRIFAGIVCGVICVAYSADEDFIPTLTRIEKFLYYPGDYHLYVRRVGLGVRDYDVRAEDLLGKDTDYQGSHLAHKGSLFVYPLHEEGVPRALCAVDMNVYVPMCRGAIAAMQSAREKTIGHRSKWVEDQQAGQKAIEQSLKMQARLESNMPKIEEVLCCVKKYNYPDDICRLIVSAYDQLIPVQDVVTCAQFAQVYMSEEPVSNEHVEIVCLQYGDKVIRVTCPVIQKILKFNNEFDVRQRKREIRFDGVCDKIPAGHYNGFVPHYRNCKGIQEKKYE
jgi:hypothetical protein